MLKPASKMKAIIWLISNSDFGLRLEKWFTEILKDFRNLSNKVRFKRREGQSNSMSDKSQGLSDVCKVHKGESFNSSL